MNFERNLVELKSVSTIVTMLTIVISQGMNELHHDKAADKHYNSGNKRTEGLRNRV